MALSPTSSHGAPAAAAPLTLTGTADEVQLTVLGKAAQAANIVEFDRSTGGNLWTLDNNGTVAQTIRGGNVGLLVGSFADARQIALCQSASVLVQVVSSLGATLLEVRDDGNVLVPGIPAADPSISGALYTTAGAVRRSP